MQVCRASDNASNQNSTATEFESQFSPNSSQRSDRSRQSLQNNICSSESAPLMCASTYQKPPLHNCDFYKQCGKASIPCDGSTHSYALDYGHKIWNKFIRNLNRLSPHGQKNLVLVSSGEATCTSISDAAFASHARCYVENDFCGLEYKGYMALTTLLGEYLFNEDANIEELIEEGACMNNALKGLMAAIARTSSN
ncbi:hypothetical protein GGI42DRAFT_344841 [Trichoderma sp. SZMC 28013]